MVNLWFAIGCSALIALILKYGEDRQVNRLALLASNYVTACSICLLLLFISPVKSQGFDPAKGFEQLGSLLSDPLTAPTVSSSQVWAILVGLFAGGMFFWSFFFYQRAVATQGVALAGAFAKLGFLLPMTLSMFIWLEFPSGLQWLAMALAVTALAMVNWPTDTTLRQSLRPVLLLLCCFGGLSEFSNKVFQKYSLQEHKPIFLLVTFGIALCFALIAVLRAKQPVQARDIWLGVAVGLPNVFTSYFLIQALATIPAAVAYPLFGAGTIGVIFLAGMLIFGERPRRRESLAICMVLLAMAFQ